MRQIEKRIALVALALICVSVALYIRTANQSVKQNLSSRILYMSPALSDSQVYSLDASAALSSSVQLTHFEFGVREFAAPAHGETAIVVTFADAQHSHAELWALDMRFSKIERVISCAPDTCYAPQISSDLRSVVFESRADQPTLWLLDLQKRAPQMLAAGQKARFSPSGAKIAYAAADSDSIFIRDLRSNVAFEITDAPEANFTWGNDDDSLYFVASALSDDNVQRQLMRADLKTETVTRLSEPNLARYSQISYAKVENTQALIYSKSSPVGTPFAVTQLYVYDIAAQQERVILDEPNMRLGGLTLSKQAQMLAVKNSVVKVGDPEVWIFDLAANTTTPLTITRAQHLATNATMPAWLNP
jgi:Tol biopolymer transport system component